MKALSLPTLVASIGVSVSGALLSFYPGLTAQSQIVNGDFSAGHTNFASDYRYDPNASILPGYYTIRTNNPVYNSGDVDFGDHTTGHGNMMLVDGHTTANKVVWSQTVIVLTNTVYRLSAWAASRDPSSPATLRFFINSDQLEPDFPLSANAGQWQHFATVWNSGSNTTANISIADTNLVYVGNDFALDDLAFELYTNASTAVSIYTAVQLVWNSQSNQTYQVQYATEAATNQWLNLGPPFPGTGSTNIFFDSTVSRPQRFYRVLPLN